MAEDNNSFIGSFNALKEAINGRPVTTSDFAVFLLGGTVGLFADVALHSALLPSMGVCAATSASGAVGVKLALEAALEKNAEIRAAKRLARQLENVRQGNYEHDARRIARELFTEAPLLKSGNGDSNHLTSLRKSGADLIRKSIIPPLITGATTSQDSASGT